MSGRITEAAKTFTVFCLPYFHKDVWIMGWVSHNRRLYVTDVHLYTIKNPNHCLDKQSYAYLTSLA